MEKFNANSEDDVAFSAAMRLASSSVLPMALRASVELGFFEIIAASGHDLLSAKEIAYHLKDSIVQGGSAFTKAHGMGGFEFMAKDQRYNNLFNQGMRGVTTIVMKKMLDIYKGFEGLTLVVDVGGGTGANLAAIVSKYPHIKCINYDLPHVIKDAPSYKGVEHAVGDMFDIVPSGEAIFLKYILHDWGDDECLKLLRNCWKALPESGKVIVVESLLPQYPYTDDISNNTLRLDLYMLLRGSGAK